MMRDAAGLETFGCSSAPPNRPGRLGDHPQLALLVFRGDPVADDGRGEPALGAQSQPFERNVAGGLPDAGGEPFHRLRAGRFGRDKTQDDGLVVGRVFERLETA